MKKLIEAVSTSLIYVCGVLSTIVILFIVLFLFKEGLGIFSNKPIEEGYEVVVNKYNPVEKLSPQQIRGIFNGDYTNWKQLGGVYDSIKTLTLSEIVYVFKEEEIGENFENLPNSINNYIENNTNVIAILPEQYLGKQHTRVKIDNISLIDILSGMDWYPTATPSPSFGAFPIIVGSFLVSLLAMLIALPFGIVVAIYLAEVAAPNVRSVCNTLIELLSGVPSVVYGFFGIVIVVPFVKEAFDLNMGETAFTGALILALITLPAIISLAADSIASVPAEQKLASLALGASHWQTIHKVLVPAAKSGIASAFVLGMGRAFGETMAVLMVTGNSAILPTSVFQPVRTITATIASELGEAPSGGMHYQSLFILGVVLFVITFVFNIIAASFTKK